MGRQDALAVGADAKVVDNHTCAQSSEVLCVRTAKARVLAAGARDDHDTPIEPHVTHPCSSPSMTSTTSFVTGTPTPYYEPPYQLPSALVVTAAFCRNR